MAPSPGPMQVKCSRRTWALGTRASQPFPGSLSWVASSGLVESRSSRPPLSRDQEKTRARTRTWAALWKPAAQASPSQAWHRDLWAMSTHLINLACIFTKNKPHTIP